MLIALLASPSLRQLAQLQSQTSSPLEDSLQAPAPVAATLLPSSLRSSMDLNQGANALAWARAHPESAMAQVQASSLSWGKASQSETMRRSFDTAIPRFPQQAWLYAARLRYTSGEFGGVPEDVPGAKPTPTPSPAPGQSGSSHPSGMTVARPTPSPADLAQSLEMARRGSKLEPDNSFFDIEAVAFHLQGSDTAAALRSLEAARLKKGFNEHLLDENQERIELRRAQGPLTFEQEVVLNAGLLLPQYTTYRSVARRLVAEAKVREERGDYAGSLRILGGLMKMGQGMRNGELLYTSLVGRAIEAIAIARGQKLPQSSNGARLSTDVVQQMRLNSFVAYASAHGRFDLAQQAQEDSRIDAALRRVQSSVISQSSFGVPMQVLETTTALWRIGAALGLQIVLGLLVLVPLSTWRFWTARGQKFNLSGVDVASATLPPLVAVAVCGWMLWQTRTVGLWGTDYDSSSVDSGVTALRMAWAVALAPVPLIAVWCAVGSVWSKRVGKATRRREKGQKSPRDMVSIVGGCVIALGWIIVSALGVAVLVVPQDADNGHTALLVRCLLPIELAIVLALHFYLRRRAAPEVFEETREPSRALDAVERARRALCWSTALAALTWVALAGACLPLRAQAQTSVDSYMKNGEMSEIRHRAGLQP